MARGSYIGGVEKSLMQFLRFLVEERHEVDLYLWTLPGKLFGNIPKEVNVLSPGKFPQSIKECTPKTFLPFVIYRLSTVRTGSYKLWSRAIGRLLPKKYDIAVSFSDNDYSRYCVIDNVEARKKIQFFHHGIYDRNLKETSQDEKYFPAYDKVVTVSGSNRDMLIEKFPGLRGKIEVINNLIDIEGIRHLATEIPDSLKEDMTKYKDILKLCTVGRLSIEKGTDLAIETARELKRRGVDFRWYFLGSETDKGLIDSLQIEDDILEKCTFTGELVNPYPYIANCDIYVHPSKIESECIVIKEAALLNKDMVVSDIPSMREVAGDLSSCRLTPRTPESMADGIISLSRSIPGRSVNGEIIEARNSETKRRLRALLSVPTNKKS